MTACMQGATPLFFFSSTSRHTRCGRDWSSDVCSSDLEFVNTGRFSYKEMQDIGGKACWDCHRDVPHTRSRSLSSTPNAHVPMPKSNVPEWLHNMEIGRASCRDSVSTTGVVVAG